MRQLNVLVICLSLLIMAGCSTYATNRYSISADNVVELKKYSDSKAGVAAFTATTPGQTEIMCRGVGPIKTPDGETFEEFVRSALISEMKLAEAYSDNSEVTLMGNLNSIDFSSTSGEWNLSLTVTSSNGKSITTDVMYDYTTSYFGETACNQTAQALMPAVQNLITKVIQHEEFPMLML